MNFQSANEYIVVIFLGGNGKLFVKYFSMKPTCPISLKDLSSDQLIPSIMMRDTFVGGQIHCRNHSSK
jgi:hypothetical protein